MIKINNKKKEKKSKMTNDRQKQNIILRTIKKFE